uniref:Spindle and centriole-associated protein 1 n=1 Tax=Callorhinchus milii TaxID=7868 RepID=V9KEX3_CALMI
MSFVRLNRSHYPHGSAKKMGRIRKRKTLDKEWDSTVSDLSVHRATPEELAKRHEKHLSKNRALAQWELGKRAIASKQRKHGQKMADSLDRQKYAIMREILFDQYQLQDVLERSDQAMAVVRDLFGDAPRRQAGFPNVTMAPESEQAATEEIIMQKCDPPTQLSILSESVMDSQALNESFNGKSHHEVLERNEEEQIYSKLKASIDKNRHLLKVKDSNTPDCTLQRTAEQSETLVNQSLGLKTPEASCTLGSSNVVLKGRKACSNMPTKRKVGTDQSCNQSTLEVLQKMVEDIDQEMEEYEHLTGREVMDRKPQSGQSLTGFTISVVSLLSRLAHNLKESELQQCKEKEEHQRLLQESKEHRVLIDALTAEILAIREDTASLQAKLHKYMVVTDAQLVFFKQMVHGFIGAEKSEQNPRKNIAPKTKEMEEQGSVDTNGGSHKPEKVNVPFPMGMPFHEEVVLESVAEGHSPLPQHKRNLLEKNRRGQSLPERVFGPAVLLSPPRQRNSHVDTESRMNLLQENATSCKIFLESSSVHPSEIHKQASMSQGIQQSEKGSTDTLSARVLLQDNPDVAHSWNFAEGHNHPSITSPDTHLPEAHLEQKIEIRESMSLGDAETCILDKKSKVEIEETQDFSFDERLKHEAMLTHIAELTLQNSTLKAHLSQFKTTKLPSPTAQIEKSIPNASSQSLQQRISELNRQSVEARNKLLLLIEQQRQITAASASPPISPIPPEGKWTGTGTRILEVCIPLPDGMESCTETTSSAESRANGNGSTANRTNSSTHLEKGDENWTPITRKIQPEKLKEEGWFALSAHI